MRIYIWINLFKLALFCHKFFKIFLFLKFLIFFFYSLCKKLFNLSTQLVFMAKSKSLLLYVCIMIYFDCFWITITNLYLYLNDWLCWRMWDGYLYGLKMIRRLLLLLSCLIGIISKILLKRSSWITIKKMPSQSVLS
jgi:hypothetical protein